MISILYILFIFVSHVFSQEKRPNLFSGLIINTKSVPIIANGYYTYTNPTENLDIEECGYITIKNGAYKATQSRIGLSHIASSVSFEGTFIEQCNKMNTCYLKSDGVYLNTTYGQIKFIKNGRKCIDSFNPPYRRYEFKPSPANGVYQYQIKSNETNIQCGFLQIEYFHSEKYQTMSVSGLYTGSFYGKDIFHEFCSHITINGKAKQYCTLMGRDENKLGNHGKIMVFEKVTPWNKNQRRKCVVSSKWTE